MRGLRGAASPGPRSVILSATRDRHQREFLQDRDLASQPLQLPVGLNSNESWPTALLLGARKEAVRGDQAPGEGARLHGVPTGTHFVGQQEARMALQTTFKSVSA